MSARDPGGGRPTNWYDPDRDPQLRMVQIKKGESDVSEGEQLTPLPGALDRHPGEPSGPVGGSATVTWRVSVHKPAELPDRDRSRCCIAKPAIATSRTCSSSG